MRLRRASDGRRKARREGIGMSENTTAERFTERLMEHRSEEQKEQYRKNFKLGEGDELVGVRMGQVFELANEFIEMLILGGGVMGDLVGLPKSRLAVLPATSHFIPQAPGCSTAPISSRR
jgi:hypothetical protein